MHHMNIVQWFARSPNISNKSWLYDQLQAQSSIFMEKIERNEKLKKTKQQQ